jgi:hypothetical protein
VHGASKGLCFVTESAVDSARHGERMIVRAYRLEFAYEASRLPAPALP